MAVVVPDPACPGCLGDGKCWVCLGVGRLRRPGTFTVACHVCQGSGRCATCATRPSVVNVIDPIALGLPAFR